MGLLELLGFKPSRDGFARIVMAAARSAGLVGELRYDREQFAVQHDGTTLFLGNAHADYCRASRSDRPLVLEHYLRAVLVTREALGSFEDARGSLLPSVRPLAAFDALRLQLPTEDGSLAPAMRPWVADLGVGLVHDSEHAVQLVSAHQLSEWNVSFEDVLQEAVSNLRDRSTPSFEEVAPGAWMSRWDDTHDASRMMLPDIVHRQGIASDPVAMIPNRNVLLLGSDSDQEGLAGIVDIARRVLAEDPRRLAAGMYRLVDGQWSAFMPEGATGEALAEVQSECLDADLAQQKELLESRLARVGDETFVASWMRMRHGTTGRIQSVTTWTEGVPSLLPRADNVAFVRLDPEDHVITSWDDAWAVMGPDMTPLPMHPERFRVERFPSAEQLERLRSKSSLDRGA